MAEYLQFEQSIVSNPTIIDLVEQIHREKWDQQQFVAAVVDAGYTERDGIEYWAIATGQVLPFIRSC